MRRYGIEKDKYIGYKVVYWIYVLMFLLSVGVQVCLSHVRVNVFWYGDVRWDQYVFSEENYAGNEIEARF